MISISGYTSEIARAFVKLLPAGEKVHLTERPSTLEAYADRFLICNGLLLGKAAIDMSAREIEATYQANFVQPAAACGRILHYNPSARICLVGSESGYRGSYDETYAAAKAALHRFVELHPLTTPAQQLVAVSPGIIGDTAMTRRRQDIERLERRRLTHPKQRFLTCAEVAAMIYHLLYVDEGYITGTVIRMHGGER